MKEDASFALHWRCLSQTGKVRRTNQDNFLFPGRVAGIVPPDGFSAGGRCSTSAGPVFGVFDGMGGEQHGDMAALIAAQTASGFDFSARGSLTAFCLEANRWICDWARAHRVASTGTTAALLRFDGSRAEACNLGDSRVYHWRGGRLRRLSTDHVFPVPGNRKPPLLQYLGVPEDELWLEPSTAGAGLLPGDRFLLCSDGLTDMADAAAITRILAARNADEAARALMDRALAAGGRDNVTLVLCDVGEKQ